MNWSVLKTMLGMAFVLAVAANAADESSADVFGSKKFFKTVAGTNEWNSAHWGNGIYREINWNGDSYDPTGWTDNHSGGSPSVYFKVDGDGVLQMLSSGARFHINSFDNSAKKKQFFKNVEWTGYYRRGSSTSSAPDWGGMVVGVRSGNLGHASGGGNDCDASTYYARFRHDGKWDFEKEWKHPNSYYQSMGVIGKQSPLWGGAKLPTNRWIGMKYIVYNSSGSSVHLELYIDSISGGDPSKAVWKKVGEADDAGKDWSGAGNGVSTVSGCKSYNGLENAYAPILEGHGAVLMRTDGSQENVVQAEYKMVSIREIDPTAKFTEEDYGNIDYSSSSVTSSSGSSSKPGSTFVGVGEDDFGFTMKYPTKEGYKVWTSAYWGKGDNYEINYWPRDAHDPTGWGDDQSGDGSSVNHFHVYGDGRMQMISNIPRFHINSLDRDLTDDKKQFFLNMEWTGYFMRNAEGGKDHGGLVVGLRSGHDNHGSSEGSDCEATTYYARFMNTGKWDFEKELKHPGSYVRSGSGIGKQDHLWGGKVLPVGRWIGMKYIVYNKDENTVRLELYIDSTSSATPPGKWELVGMAEDDGKSWSGASGNASTIEGCEEFGLISAYTAITRGGGTALMRSDNDNPYYKFVSLREIDPVAIPVYSSSSSFEGKSSSSNALNVSSSSIENGNSSNSQEHESLSSSSCSEFDMSSSSSEMNFSSSTEEDSSSSGSEFGSSSSFEEKSSSSEKKMGIAQGTVHSSFVAVDGRNIRIFVDVSHRDVVLMDAQGRILQRAYVQQGNFSLEVPSAGIYLVRVDNQMQRVVVR